MIGKILLSEGSVKKRIKRLLIYGSRRNGAMKSWKRRHQIVFNKHPHYQKPIEQSLVKKHRKIWEPFNKRFKNSTLQISSSISGITDPYIIPEEIFQADIEPTLNRYPESHWQAHKSVYNRMFTKGLFPEDILHSVDGLYYDDCYCSVSADQAFNLLMDASYPVILKPNSGTYGGSGISILKNSTEAVSALKQESNCVFQKLIIQHEETARYHPESLNTVRVYLYRSVSDNKYHIINTVFRMGNGAFIDNVAAGGLVSLITPEGCLHGYALDRFGEKYEHHPSSGMSFDGKIPEFQEMKKLAVRIAEQLFMLRIVGLDLCYDHEGKWRMVEINTKGHSIRFAQYAGIPFLGKFTEEVIEYCNMNHWAIRY